MKTMNIAGKQIRYVAENHRWMLGEKKLGLCADGVLRGEGEVIPLNKDELAELKRLEQAAFYESLDEDGKAAFVARLKHTLAVEIDFCMCECDGTCETRHYDIRARKLEQALKGGDVFEMMQAYNAK